MKNTMLNKCLSVSTLFFGVLWSAAASSAITIEVQNNPPGSPPVITFPTPPSSLSQAISDDFFFIFGNWYEAKEGGGWAGGQVDLSRSIITASCSINVGGYVWVTGTSPNQELWIAVTHGEIKDPPVGSNDLICDDIQMEFDNGYTRPGFPAASAGAWVTSIDEASLQTGDVALPVVSGVFYNVQVLAPAILGRSHCSTDTGGSGGEIEVGYSNNGVGTPSSFIFNDDISGGGFLACEIDGQLFSLDMYGKAQIDTQCTDPVRACNTPGTPNPSPLSTGKITVYR